MIYKTVNYKILKFFSSCLEIVVSESIFERGFSEFVIFSLKTR